MRHLGYIRVTAAQATGDGGIRMDADRAVASVKHYNSMLGPVPVRELLGVANSMGKKGPVFATSQYSKAAQDFAAANGVTLYIIDPVAGTLRTADGQDPDAGPEQ